MAPTETTEESSIVPTTSVPSPHFVLFPLVAQGHIIPMVDLARLLAERGARASLVTTPVNAARLHGVAELAIDIIGLPFPPADDGLPLGCENIDQVTDRNHFIPRYHAINRLAGPLESYLRGLARPPSCIISDWSNSWTAGVASNLGIPRLFFHGPSCFYSLCDLNTSTLGLHERASSSAEAEGHERYVVPGMPVRVEVTKATCLGFLDAPGFEAFREDALEAMRTADGAVVNTFLDLEEQFVACYEGALGNKPVWTLGPLCLNRNRDAESMASRGCKLSVDQSAVTGWLDAMDPGSVIFVSFGSIARKPPKQLYEVGHGLEDSGKPFLWVVKDSEVASPEAREWVQALEARTVGRGLVVRGWAPQLAILSHRAVGGFLTHCGWNSLLESITHGVPVVTWPHFTDQFMNERLAVDVLGIGVPVGAALPVRLISDDDETVRVVRGDVARAVSELMGRGEVAEERRRKTMEYGERARRSMEEGGSSYENLTLLIQSFRRSSGSETDSGLQKEQQEKYLFSG